MMVDVYIFKNFNKQSINNILQIKQTNFQQDNKDWTKSISYRDYYPI